MPPSLVTLAVQAQLQPLHRAFKRLAHWTWHRREEAKQVHFPFSEETITETILLYLAVNYSAEIQVQAFNKRQEARTGADWEWCFYNKQQNQFVQTLVQAKLLDNLDVEYAHLDHKIGSSGILQIDQLLATARARNIPALYVFYNHFTDTSRVPVQTCNCYGCQECWGCSVALAPAVQARLPDKTFDTLSRISKPWVCLLCPGPGGIGGPQNTPNRVATALQPLVRQMLDVDVAGTRDILPYRDMIRSEPPPYFSQVRRLQGVEREAERDSIVETLAAENPGVAGVVLITDDTPKTVAKVSRQD